MTSRFSMLYLIALTAYMLYFIAFTVYHDDVIHVVAGRPASPAIVVSQYVSPNLDRRSPPKVTPVSCAQQLPNHHSPRQPTLPAQPTSHQAENKRAALPEVEMALEAQMINAAPLQTSTPEAPLPSPITQRNKQMAAFVASNQPVCQSSPKLGHSMPPTANRISDSTCTSMGDDTVFLTPGNWVPSIILSANTH